MKGADMQTSHKGTSRANRGAHSQAVGWISRQKSSRRPVEGETFFLTSRFIELRDARRIGHTAAETISDELLPARRTQSIGELVAHAECKSAMDPSTLAPEQRIAAAFD